MPNAAETIPSCESDRFRLKKRPKKIPLLQLTVQSQSGCKSLKAPVPASTPFTSPLMTPSRSLQAEGRFQRSLHQFDPLKCTPCSIEFSFVLSALQALSAAAGC
jgi:hypothetical protein